MIGGFVTFRYGDNFNERAVRKIAENRTGFEGMPGLRSKAFTLRNKTLGLGSRCVPPSCRFAPSVAPAN